MRFSLWKTANWTTGDGSGGTINTSAPNYGGWNEFQTITPNSNGIIAAQLGSGTALPMLDFEKHKYLQVETKSVGQPDTSYVLLGRKFIGSVAYAKNAESVQNRTVGTASGNILILGSDGKIGIAQMGSGTNTLEFTINAGNGAGDTTLTFGNTLLPQTLKYSSTNARFEFSKDVYVAGNLGISGTLSGSILHAQSHFTSSGSAVFGGSARFNSTTIMNGVTYAWPASPASGSGKVLKVNPATGQLSWSDDLNTGLSQGAGDSRYVNTSGDTMTGALKVRANLSGSTLNVDGISTFNGVTTHNANVKVHGNLSGSTLTVDGTTTLTGLKNCGTLTTDANGVLGCNTNATWGSGSYTMRTLSTTLSKTSSTTLTDTGLKFNIPANQTWIYEYRISFITASNTPDFRFALTAPAGSNCNTHLARVGDGNVTNVYRTQTCGSTIVIPATGGTPNTASIFGQVVTSGTAGNMMLQWAQDTSNGTAIFLNSGSTITAFRAVGSDVAEVYQTQDPSILPGTIVSVDPDHPLNVRRSLGAQDHTVLGVISTKPGLTLGGEDLVGKSGIPVFLALAGRVPVMVSDENGPIRPGDLLTTSSTPGVAMKATKAGPIIGKALSAYNGTGIGMVTIFVQNQSSMGLPGN